MRLMGTCGTCGSQMVSNYYWRRAGDVARAEMLHQGLRPSRRVDECHNCSQARARREQAAREGPSTATYRRAELVAEWELFVDHTLTLKENCRQLAPRLGMQSRTLEKALNRAGIYAWPITTSGWSGISYKDQPQISKCMTCVIRDADLGAKIAELKRLSYLAQDDSRSSRKALAEIPVAKTLVAKARAALDSHLAACSDELKVPA